MAKKPGKSVKKVNTSKPGVRYAKLPSAWKLARITSTILWENKRLFIGITLVYGLLNLVLVQGLAAANDVNSIKDQFDQASNGNYGSVGSTLSVFVVLVGSAGSGSSQAAGVYQLFLSLFASLAIIWALRHIVAGTNIRVRDAYYKGMYPLIPFILVLVVIALQLIPLVIGSSIYNLVATYSIAVDLLEKLLWVVLFSLFALLSFYFISSSIFALYIVTLPDMTPIKALRTARDLVAARRLTVMLKVLCLPVILLIIAAVIMAPFIIFLAPIAQWIFFLLTISSLAFIHTYLYTLYREMLHED